MNINQEIMSDGFSKYKIDTSSEGWSFYQPMLHRFTAADKGTPHDHPWSFTTHIIKGSYIERVYTLLPDGGFSYEDHHWQAGTAHYVAAQTIHSIIALPDGDCWTMVIPGDGDGTWRHWEFREHGIYCRQWNEQEFKKHTLAQTDTKE